MRKVSSVREECSSLANGLLDRTFGVDCPGSHVAGSPPLAVIGCRRVHRNSVHELGRLLPSALDRGRRGNRGCRECRAGESRAEGEQEWRTGPTPLRGLLFHLQSSKQAGHERRQSGFPLLSNCVVTYCSLLSYSIPPWTHPTPRSELRTPEVPASTFNPPAPLGSSRVRQRAAE